MFNKLFQRVQNTFSSTISGTTMNIDKYQVTIQQQIAEGGFGQIYSCTDQNGTQYALKSLQSPDKEHYDAVVNEFNMQQTVSSHPNIVSVYGMSTDQTSKTTMILMDFCEETCINLMNQNFHSGFQVPLIVEIFEAICLATVECHSKGIIHRDLKTENLLKKRNTWKLCDFGSATKKIYLLDDTSEINLASDDIERNTTAQYRAPEMCDLYRRQKVDFKADVWALGCTLFRLCAFQDAFPDGSNLQILNAKIRWPDNRRIDPILKRLISEILIVNPDDRPTSKNVLVKLAQLFPTLVSEKVKSLSNSEPIIEKPLEVEKPIEKKIAQTVAEVQKPVQVVETQNSFNPFAPKTNDDAPKNNDFAQQTNDFAPQINDFAPPQPEVFDPFGISLFPAFTPQKDQPDLLVGSPTFESFSSISLDELNSDPDGFAKNCLKKDQFELSPIIYSIVNSTYEFPELYLFKLVYHSGKNAPIVVNLIPDLKDQNNLLFKTLLVQFFTSFPQFEGNFSLHSFTKENRAKPPPPGTPPISCEVVRSFLTLIDAGIKIIRNNKYEPFAELVVSAYQAITYVIAKLIHFNINVLYLTQSAVPQLKNHHFQLSRALKQFQGNVKFPDEPYDFNDQTFLQKVRAPHCKSYV